ncbi:MAG: glutathione S-transferase family protein [Alphaproteobacteria bacterium]|nr:glutathione S-transferase family protein [Alphaproteobacteria bacterium]MCB9928402.1 glutathione S-transferase family protein [Alphaproteobacteria bacterium]
MGERVLWGAVSSRALRVHWALIELGLAYRSVPIQSRSGETETPEYGRLNPRRKIPTFRDGDLVLTESAAIVTYLAETYGTPERSLIPTAQPMRAKYFEWLSFVAMELDATALYVLRRHEGLPEIYGAAPVACRAARAYFDKMIRASAADLADGRRYLTGEAFTGADICMTTVLDWAERYDCPLPEAWLAYRERVRERPSYAAALAANRAPA